VRDDETGLVDGDCPVEKEIEIDRPGTLPMVQVTSHRSLNLSAYLKQALRRYVGFHLHHAVQEPTVPGLRPVIHRLRFIEGGHSHQLRMRQETQQGDGPVAIIQPVPHV
jgi:hypothetical protein